MNSLKIKNKMMAGVLLLLLLCLFSACTNAEKEEKTGDKVYQIYCLNKAETKVIAHEYRTNEGDINEEIEKVLDQLSSTPVSVSEKVPIADKVIVKSYDYENFMVTLDFASSYYELEPIAEVLTRAAIVRSLTQIDGVNYVVFHINGEMLTDSSGNMVGTMTSTTFVDNAGAEINSYETVRLVLFFANETGDKLVVTNRTVDYNTNISLEKLVVEQLISGPTIAEAFPVLASDTKVVNVTTRDGTCYVNFDTSFLNQTTKVSADVVIYSITNSLVELPNINKVQIMVDGESDVNFKETYSLKTIFERNLDVVEMN